MSWCKMSQNKQKTSDKVINNQLFFPQQMTVCKVHQWEQVVIYLCDQQQDQESESKTDHSNRRWMSVVQRKSLRAQVNFHLRPVVLMWSSDWNNKRSSHVFSRYCEFQVLGSLPTSDQFKVLFNEAGGLTLRSRFFRFFRQKKPTWSNLLTSLWCKSYVCSLIDWDPLVHTSV